MLLGVDTSAESRFFFDSDALRRKDIALRGRRDDDAGMETRSEIHDGMFPFQDLTVRVSKTVLRQSLERGKVAGARSTVMPNV